MHFHLEGRFERVDQSLALLIYPHYQALNVNGRSKLGRLLNRLSDLGFKQIRSLPSSLVVDGGAGIQRVEAVLREQLISPRSESVRAALEAMRIWFALGAQDVIPSPPSTLIAEVSNKVLSRRSPELINAIETSAYLLESSPAQHSDLILGNLSLALEYLLVGTAIPTYSEFDAATSKQQVFDVYQLPHAQHAAAKLARALRSQLNQEDQNQPDIIQRWQEASKSSPLPEVAKVFADA